MARDNRRNEVYETAEKWKKNCLINDGSLLWEGESIWTKANLYRFRMIFVERPDESGSNFDDKLRKQLQNEPTEVYKLAIELLYIYYLFPSYHSLKYETKIKKLQLVASWAEVELDLENPAFKALEYGLGSTGTFYNTQKYFELSYLYYVADKIKDVDLDTRRKILSDPIEFKKLSEDAREQIGKRVQSQHTILHLIHPEYYEQMASGGDKQKIIKAFDNYLEGQTIEDIDEKLFVIREKLQEKYGEEIHFYETPEIVEQWRERPRPSKKSEKPKIDLTKIAEEAFGRETTGSTKVNFDIETPPTGLVFENIDIIWEQIRTALRNGKHIILTGPPGTGKSKLASAICELYGVESMMVTASSNWSTFETIGGYRPDRQGKLYFNEGIFLESVKNTETYETQNKWLIIDELNRADIDKAFGPLFSVLAGDSVTLPFESESGKKIVLSPEDEDLLEDDHTYVIPNDWRIIATMNTIDKASLYEISYAFMRRFAFIPVGVPKDITTELMEEYLNIWRISNYPYVKELIHIWKLINNYRKIGPAIIEDIAKHTVDNEGGFTSALILYVLPQFEGLPLNHIYEFINKLLDETSLLISKEQLDDFVQDFFDVGVF